VLTEGGTRCFAICSSCERRGGRSLTRGWLTVLWWVLVPVLGLALVALALRALR